MSRHHFLPSQDHIGSKRSECEGGPVAEGGWQERMSLGLSRGVCEGCDTNLAQSGKEKVANVIYIYPSLVKHSLPL